MQIGLFQVINISLKVVFLFQSFLVVTVSKGNFNLQSALHARFSKIPFALILLQKKRKEIVGIKHFSSQKIKVYLKLQRQTRSNTKLHLIIKIITNSNLFSHWSPSLFWAVYSVTPRYHILEPHSIILLSLPTPLPPASPTPLPPASPTPLRLYLPIPLVPHNSATLLPHHIIEQL